MEDLELVINCPECGNIGIEATSAKTVRKDGQQQVRCLHHECKNYFHRTHPEFILKALIERFNGLEKIVDRLLSFKEYVEDELQKINEEISEIKNS